MENTRRSNGSEHEELKRSSPPSFVVLHSRALKRDTEGVLAAVEGKTRQFSATVNNLVQRRAGYRVRIHSRSIKKEMRKEKGNVDRNKKEKEGMRRS